MFMGIIEAISDIDNIMNIIGTVFWILLAYIALYVLKCHVV